jgi:hypothetical protein
METVSICAGVEGHERRPEGGKAAMDGGVSERPGPEGAVRMTATGGRLPLNIPPDPRHGFSCLHSS